MPLILCLLVLLHLLPELRDGHGVVLLLDLRVAKCRDLGATHRLRRIPGTSQLCCGDAELGLKGGDLATSSLEASLALLTALRACASRRAGVVVATSICQTQQ
jgi:hypothetical protein